MQHDVQEFNRVLQDALEAKMKVYAYLGLFRTKGSSLVYNRTHPLMVLSRSSSWAR